MENLNDLVIFVKVVEAGGFSSAAGALHMSPGLVSRRLRHLEEELGVQLVNRSTRHIGLTEAGEAFYKECARALAAIETARSAAVGLSEEPRGTLKVHAAVGVGQSLVADAAIAFKQAYPNMTIDLHVGSHRVNLLKDGYDVVFKTSTVTDSSLECREFGYIRHVIAASPDYLRRAGSPSVPDDLQHHDCLIQYGRRPPTEWHFLGPQGSLCGAGSRAASEAPARSRCARRRRAASASPMSRNTCSTATATKATCRSCLTTAWRRSGCSRPTTPARAICRPRFRPSSIASSWWMPAGPCSPRARANAAWPRDSGRWSEYSGIDIRNGRPNNKIYFDFLAGNQSAVPSLSSESRMKTGG